MDVYSSVYSVCNLHVLLAEARLGDDLVEDVPVVAHHVDGLLEGDLLEDVLVEAHRVDGQLVDDLVEVHHVGDQLGDDLVEVLLEGVLLVEVLPEDDLVDVGMGRPFVEEAFLVGYNLIWLALSSTYDTNSLHPPDQNSIGLAVHVACQPSPMLHLLVAPLR